MEISALQLAALSLPTILMQLRSQGEITFIVCVLAVWGLFVWLKEKWRVHETKSWPTATGSLSNIKAEKVNGGLNGVDYYKVSFTYCYQPKQQECTGKYSFTVTSQDQADGAAAGLENKTVCVHFKPGNEAKSVLWEDEVWNIWWETYWEISHRDVPSQA